MTENKQIHIQKFKSDNLEAVSNLCSLCLKNINSKDITPEQTKFLLDHFTPESIKKSSKKVDIYVAVMGNDVVGTASLQENNIKAVFVHPDYHGRKIGANLMSYLEKILKDNGYKTASLTSSKYAVGFYKKLGYKIIEKINPPEVGEMTVMTKNI